MRRHNGISRLVFPFVAFVISLGPAWGQAPQTNNPKIGNLLDQYATIAGGWHLNQKCKFLGTDLAREFEWRVAMITVVVHAKLGSQIALTLQGAARKTVEEKYAGCDATAETIVIQTVTLARELSPTLGMKPYDPRTTYPAYMVVRYQSVLIGLAVEDRCRAGYSPVHQQFLGVYRPYLPCSLRGQLRPQHKFRPGNHRVHRERDCRTGL